jgi:phage shock protein C
VKGSDMDQTRKLYRSQTDRKLAGVCGGLADYLKLDAIIIRVGFVVLTVLAEPVSPIYLSTWRCGCSSPSKPRASRWDVLSDKAASRCGSTFGSARPTRSRRGEQ